jgi:putative transposase
MTSDHHGWVIHIATWLLTATDDILGTHMIWNQRHLMAVLREYEDFYNTHRPHRT